MNRYIALLRGINISGKNKIAMSELKEGFIKLHFTDVSTYLNSGNVIFSSDIDDKNILSDNIKSMIKDRFDLDIPIFIILQEELKEILNNLKNCRKQQNNFCKRRNIYSGRGGKWKAWIY